VKITKLASPLGCVTLEENLTYFFPFSQKKSLVNKLLKNEVGIRHLRVLQWKHGGTNDQQLLSSFKFVSRPQLPKG